MPVYDLPQQHRTYNYNIMHNVPATTSTSVLYGFNLRHIVAICKDIIKTLSFFPAHTLSNFFSVIS
jgi:hypothetical protein